MILLHEKYEKNYVEELEDISLLFKEYQDFCLNKICLNKNFLNMCPFEFYFTRIFNFLHKKLCMLYRKMILFLI